MQLERLEFEFDTGIDPLTGEKRPPVRAVSRPEDRFDLYYVGEVLHAWGYPGRKPLAMCEHIEAI